MLAVWLVLTGVGPVAANGSLFASHGSTVTPLISSGTQPDARVARASLFHETDDGLLAPPRARATRPSLPYAAPAPYASPVEQLRQLIQIAESRRDGYDAVQHGAKIKPTKPPTRMSIGEIYRWIEATPRQPHAIGRYQFIPKTLKRLVRQLGLKASTRFSPLVQDQLADILLAEAGLIKLKAGHITRRAFMRNLAKIWAGFPLPNGQSYYQGYAGNKASMSWAAFDLEMARIFPG